MEYTDYSHFAVIPLATLQLDWAQFPVLAIIYTILHGPGHSYYFPYAVP